MWRHTEEGRKHNPHCRKLSADKKIYLGGRQRPNNTSKCSNLLSNHHRNKKWQVYLNILMCNTMQIISSQPAKLLQKWTSQSEHLPDTAVHSTAGYVSKQHFKTHVKTSLSQDKLIVSKSQHTNYPLTQTKCSIIHPCGVKCIERTKNKNSK